MRNPQTTFATAIVTSAALLALWGAAGAQTSGSGGTTPTQADFDQCNREAQTMGGSASPGGSTSTGTTSGGTTSGGTTSGGGMASGSLGGGATGGSTTGAAGATGGTGSTSGGSTLSSGASSSDTTGLQGIASAGSSDPAYQQAYRDCMRRRGF